MADDAIDTARRQRMPGLDGDQPAEPLPEHKHRPHPQCTAGDVENNTNPADGVAVEGPKLLPICVGRQPRVQHADHREGDQNPAVGTILAHTWAQIAAAEQPRAGQREGYDRDGNQGRVGEEGAKPAPAEHGKAEKEQRRHDAHDRQSECGLHGRTRKVLERPRRNTIYCTKHSNICRSGYGAIDQQSTTISKLGGVEVDPIYLGPIKERPHSYTYDPSPGMTNTVNMPHRVLVYDARPIAADLSLDPEGFELVG